MKYIYWTVISISVLLLSSAFSTTRAIELSLNQSLFESGDTLVMTLKEDWTGEVDVYIALNQPSENGLKLWYLTPNGFNPNMRAYSQTVQASGGIKEVFRIVLPEIPGGEYTFYAVLMLPNTFQLISDIVKASLVFQAKTQVTPTPSEVFRDLLQDGSEGPEMVNIPAGTFRMGDIQGDGYFNEQPVHEVSVDSFAMGRYEVTVGEFRQFVNGTGYQTDAEKGDGCYVYDGNSWGYKTDASWRNLYFSQDENHPVACISRNDVTAYTEWLSEQTGHSYRLPTEAEWEYSARAGTETNYAWGNEIGTNKANCSNYHCGDSFDYTAPVGSFDANPFGLYDTVGNVWEWTCSSYESSYNGQEQLCGSGDSYRVLRGGAWSDEQFSVRLAYRYQFSGDDRDFFVGFRLSRH